MHFWTDDEANFILDNLNMNARELASMFGITMKAIEWKRAKLRASVKKLGAE